MQWTYCVTIGNSVTTIGNNALQNCSGLTSITVNEGNTKYHSNGNCLIETDSKTLIVGCKTSVIPDDGSVTSIGSQAFSSCSGLTSITVDEGNTKYHSSGNCLIETESKTLITGCKTSVIPDDGSVTSIGSYAFNNCNGLTSITIPNSVTSIGNYAFSSCSKLTKMTILATTPPTLSSTIAISSVTTKIYIPAGTLSAYTSATNWKSFGSRFVELSA